jgi:hypothetical protein
MNGYNEEQPVREEELKPKQRVIKFRAWDGKNMFFPSQITFDECGWHVEKGRGVSIPYQPHVVLMQFTGFPDKDGKDIYEGDCLQDPGGNILLVFWNTNAGEWSLDHEEGIQSLTLSCSKWARVAGNVYQDKHLLS